MMENCGCSPLAAALAPLTQMVLTAHDLEDVRASTAHGVRVVAPYRAFALYETAEAGALDVTLRQGDQLGLAESAVEELLVERVSKTGRTASTLDRFVSEREQRVADDYMRRRSLCLARPLKAHGNLAGVAVVHYDERAALGDGEFDTLRRFLDTAAIAIAGARTRTELQDFAYSDALTGLANRRRLEAELVRLAGARVSLLLIDFDGLKAVNDSLGYDRGDALIRSIGETLAGSARRDELAARLGGDEFVLVIPGAERAEAVLRAEELTELLDHVTLGEDLGELFNGASVGWATAEPGEDLWRVLMRASMEMRFRKRRRKTDREVSQPAPGELGFGGRPQQ